MADTGPGILRELLAVFSFDVDTKGLERGENQLAGFKEKVKQFGEALVAAFAVEAVREFVESQVAAMRSIEHTAAALGISTERVQQFQFAAESLGMESDRLLNLMGRLQVSQQGAATGSGQAAKAFQALGVHVKDSSGHFKAADEVLLDVADGIAKTGDASKAAAIVTELFGRQGRALLPFLKQGREGVEKLAEDFHALGGGYDEITLKRGKEFEKQQARLKLVMVGIKNAIVGAILPALTWLTGKITAVVNGIREWAKGTTIVQTTLTVLGAVAIALAASVIAAWLPVILPFLLWAAALAGIVLLIDDIVGLFTGKQSLIGEAIDKIFGKGASLEVVRELKQDWKLLAEFIHDAVGWIKEFLSHLDMLRSVLPKGVGVLDLFNPIKGAFKAVRAQMPEAGEAEPEWTKYTSRYYWLGKLFGSDQGGPQLTPSVAGGGGGLHLAPTVNVHVQAPPGTDPKTFGQVAADAGADVLHRETRAAAATLQRAGR